MQLDPAADAIYRFVDGWRVDVGRRTLSRDGVPIDIGSRAFDLLIVMIEKRARVLSKKELLDKAWSGFIVGEENLYVQISKIRQLFGKDAILTIPGRGYRFMLKLEDAPPGTEEAAIPPRSASSLAPVPAPAQAPLTWSESRLVGRAAHLAELLGLIQRHRLVTVVGPGGIGKTVLALEALRCSQANEQCQVIWVDLSSASNEAEMIRAIAQAMNLLVRADESPQADIITALAGQPARLFLDNAEQLACPLRTFLALLLRQTQTLQICVTSQFSIKVDGEKIYRLPPLGIPSEEVSSAQAQGFSSVELFVSHANFVGGKFEITDDNLLQVVDICRRLDGIPLAIRLAARRLPVLGIAELHRRIAQSMSLLRHPEPSGPMRQQTITATLEWSYQLLAPREQKILRRLSVFVGSFVLRNACEVLLEEGIPEHEFIDSLDVLVDHSLIMMSSDEMPRYRLFEPAREFAHRLLQEHGEVAAASAAHARSMARTMAECRADYLLMSERELFDKYYRKRENVRAALEWSMVHAPAQAVSMAADWSILFGGRLATVAETQAINQRVEPLLSDQVEPDEQARYWLCRAARLVRQDDTTMLRFARRAEALYAQQGHLRGRYESLTWCAVSMANTVEDASRCIELMQSIEDPAWPLKLRSLFPYAACNVLQRQGRYREALAINAQAIRYARELGADSWVETGYFQEMCCLILANDLQAAWQRAQAATNFSASFRSAVGRMLQLSIAALHLLLDKVSDARPLLEEYVRLGRIHGRRWSGNASNIYALLLVKERRWSDAALAVGFADACSERAGGRLPGLQLLIDKARAELAANMPADQISELMSMGHQLPEAVVEALVLNRPSSPAID